MTSTAPRSVAAAAKAPCSGPFGPSKVMASVGRPMPGPETAASSCGEAPAGIIIAGVVPPGAGAAAGGAAGAGLPSPAGVAAGVAADVPGAEAAGAPLPGAGELD